MKILRIDGVIGDWLNSGEEFQYRLSELDLESGEELLVVMHSIGGSVIEGFSIYNQISALKNPTRLKIEGFCASIASLIAMAFDKVEISEVSQFMIHRASLALQGDKNELEKQAEILKSIDSTMIQVFVSKTGLPEKKIEAMLDAETWFSANEALEAGFVDTVVDKIDAKMAASYLSNLNTKNMNFKKLLSQLAGNTETEETKVVEETKTVVEATEQKAETETETEDIPDVVTREEFNTLKEIIEALVKGLEAKDELDGKEKESDEKISDLVNEKFAEVLKRLPASKGQPTASKTAFSEKPKYTDKFAHFREEQKLIEDKTRLQ